jgi:hypothetical protein
MKYLKKSQINQVKPHWRKFVRAAWRRGEKVPWGVIFLADPKFSLTKAEIEHISDLNEKFQWEK